MQFVFGFCATTTADVCAVVNVKKIMCETIFRHFVVYLYLFKDATVVIRLCFQKYFPLDQAIFKICSKIFLRNNFGFNVLIHICGSLYTIKRRCTSRRLKVHCTCYKSSLFYFIFVFSPKLFVKKGLTLV